jgi:aspartate/methionine/tyrosine aminotransferase
MSFDVDLFHAMGLSRLAHDLKAQGRSIIHMEFGQPSTGAPAAAIAHAHTMLDTDPGSYTEGPALKARLSQHYAETYGVEVSPERIWLTCGASPALVLALASQFEAGARIAMARPGYVAYRNTVKALKMTPVEIACGADVGFQLTAAALAVLDPPPAGVILASPANPTGTVIAPEEMAAIAKLCGERGIRIISDEIYHGLTYEAPARSMLEFTDQCLVVNSFSKYFSMVGWRLGWLVAPADQVRTVHAFGANMFLTAPSLSIAAGLVAMDCADELQGHVETYRANRALLLDALPALGLTAIAPPDGAFYIYADIGHLTNDSMAFCEKLLRDTGVVAAPGIDHDPVDGHRFIRFSFAVSTDLVRDAISRLIPWFAAQPGRA